MVPCPSQRAGRGSLRFQPHGARQRAIMSFAKGKRVPRAVHRSAPAAPPGSAPRMWPEFRLPVLRNGDRFRKKNHVGASNAFPALLFPGVPNGARVLCRVLRLRAFSVQTHAGLRDVALPVVGIRGYSARGAGRKPRAWQAPGSRCSSPMDVQRRAEPCCVSAPTGRRGAGIALWQR